MTRRTLVHSVIWAAVAALPVAAQTPAPEPFEEMFSTLLDANNPRRVMKWEINGDFTMEFRVAISANGTPQQDQGVRVAVYHENGDPVEGGEILVGNTTTYTFDLSTDTYYIVLDLGVEDDELPITALYAYGDGLLKVRPNGQRVRIKGDLPVDPLNPPPSALYLPGPYPLSIDNFLPPSQWAFPRSETMIYLVDWS
jgi:hypothetical protein